MHPAHLFLFALTACITAPCDPTDQRLLAEKNAALLAAYTEVVGPRFQLGSGAGSESQPHGNEINEPAASSGHPHQSWTVTARMLQDNQFKPSSVLVNKMMNSLTKIGIPPDYIAMWPISVMLILVLACMNRPGRGGQPDLPPSYDPANTQYSFRQWLTDVQMWTLHTRRPVRSQAYAIVSQLEGEARLISRQLSADELLNGGEIGGLPVDPVTFLLATMYDQMVEPVESAVTQATQQSVQRVTLSDQTHVSRPEETPPAAVGGEGSPEVSPTNTNSVFRRVAITEESDSDSLHSATEDAALERATTYYQVAAQDHDPSLQDSDQGPFSEASLAQHTLQTNNLHFAGPVLTFHKPNGQPLDPKDENSTGLTLIDTQVSTRRSRSRTPRSDSVTSGDTIPWDDEELMRAESIRQKRITRDVAQASLEEAMSTAPLDITCLYHQFYGTSDPKQTGRPDPTWENPRQSEKRRPITTALAPQLPSLDLPILNPASRSVMAPKGDPPMPRWRWINDCHQQSLPKETGDHWRAVTWQSPVLPSAEQRQSPSRQAGFVENHNMSPRSTQLVEHTDCTVDVSKFRTDTVFPVAPATAADAQTLVDDWNSGRNRFAVSDDANPDAESQPRSAAVNATSESGITSVYHGATRLSGEHQGPVVDPGSIFNLCGDRWAKTHYRIAETHGRTAKHAKRDQPLQVAGVGHGTQGAKFDVNIPVALKTTTGNFKIGAFDAPCIQDSDIPGLLGLKSLEENRAILDTVHSRLYFLGKGDCDLMSLLPPGTECYDLQKSTSGHLILPMTYYADLDKARQSAKGFADEAPRALHVDEHPAAEVLGAPPGLESVPVSAAAVAATPQDAWKAMYTPPAGAAAAANPPTPTTNELLAMLPDACTEACSHLDADQLRHLAAAFGYQATQQIEESQDDTE